mgnify:CR=1 FL=1
MKLYRHLSFIDWGRMKLMRTLIASRGRRNELIPALTSVMVVGTGMSGGRGRGDPSPTRRPSSGQRQRPAMYLSP